MIEFNNIFCFHTFSLIQRAWKNNDNQDKLTNRAKEKEQKSNQLNTVTTEHIAQTTQLINRSEENKEKS